MSSLPTGRACPIDTREKKPMNEQSPNPNPNEAPSITTSPTLLQRIFTRENLIALAICLILIALLIATADTAPQWIYQGF